MAEIDDGAPPDDGGDAARFAVLLWFAAFGLAGLGLYRMFNEQELVGGDAYNLVIAAQRGLGWVGAALLLGILAAALQISAAIARRK